MLMNRLIKMRQEPINPPASKFRDCERKNGEGKNRQDYMQNLHGK